MLQLFEFKTFLTKRNILIFVILIALVLKYKNLAEPAFLGMILTYTGWLPTVIWRGMLAEHFWYVFNRHILL